MKVWIVFSEMSSDPIKGVYAEERLANEAARLWSLKRSDTETDVGVMEFEVFQ